MLIEVKVKVTRTIDDKTRKKVETYLLQKDFFSAAEYDIADYLTKEHVDDYEILSLRQSQIKEIADQFTGEHAYLATLKDIFIDDEGNEKSLRYKVLLWADDLTSATQNARQLQREGYNMQIEGLKEVNYIYFNPVSTASTN